MPTLNLSFPMIASQWNETRSRWFLMIHMCSAKFYISVLDPRTYCLHNSATFPHQNFYHVASMCFDLCNNFMFTRDCVFLHFLALPKPRTEMVSSEFFSVHSSSKYKSPIVCLVLEHKSPTFQWLLLFSSGLGGNIR